MTPPDARELDPNGKGDRRPLMAVFTSHWLAMLGVGLVLTAIVIWGCLLSVKLRGGADNPYIGLAMTIAGFVLILGAAITPLGLFLGRRRLSQHAAATDTRAMWRRLFVFLAITSLINIVIASQTTEQVMHRMESREFCGSCHVMTPESRAFTQGPHAGILCVDCHVGNGQVGFIKSKVQGTRQLISVLTDTVEKPIETAIESGKMIPSEQTCEECHWKQNPADARLKMIRSYDDDETNTPETTILTMNVGGTRMGGIHGTHFGEGIEIHFVATDNLRQNIPWVEYKDKKAGTTRAFVKKGADPASFANAPRITMQCFDCHNRAAHIFQLPERAVDRALMLGRMSSSLPYLKKTSVEILKKEYASSEAAAAEIPAALVSYYQKSYPEVSRTRAGDIEEAGGVLADIYSRNVFPDLGVKWGTYPDNRGHQDFPGCFRCHDGDHATSSGEAITKNCFVCHFPSSVGDENPEVLKLLGVDRMLQKLQKK
jgi:nitrate/TMAO reductase-like tetraheme cytochrome c subunit